MPFTGHALHINRSDLTETEIVPLTLNDPAPGKAILKIDGFSLTANNITYAVAPDAVGYWNFFPVEKDGWGQVPVWGFADVVASAHPDRFVVIDGMRTEDEVASEVAREVEARLAER